MQHLGKHQPGAQERQRNKATVHRADATGSLYWLLIAFS